MTDHSPITRFDDTLINGSPDINEISQWRRDLMRMLRALDDIEYDQEFETVAGKIQRLTNDKKIPRPIASMMRTITAARNEMEYDDRPMSLPEAVAVRANWAAVRYWFGTNAG